jgi:hypothetical protein
MQDLSDVETSTIYYWFNYLNRAFYDLLKNYNPTQILENETYSVTNSLTTALPADFETLGVYGCGLWLLDSNSRPSIELTLNDVTDSAMGYRIEGSNLVISGVTGSVKMYYIPALEDVSEAETATVIPAIYSKFCVDFLKKCYYEWDLQPSEESLADFRLVREMDRVAKGLARTSLTYIM